MGSPAQRLLSRHTHTTHPTSTKLLKPKPLSTSMVSTQLKEVRQQQKQYHDKSAHQRPLKHNEVVRMQTDKGFQRLAVVKSTRDSPRSYIVTSDGADYVRNRRHLLPVSEPTPQNSQQDSYATGLQNPPVGDGAHTTEGQKQQSVPLPSLAACPLPPSTPPPSSRPVATQLGSPQRSHAPGRVVRLNPKYFDT